MTNVKSRLLQVLEATQEYNFSKGFLSSPGPAQLLQKVTWNSQLQNPERKKTTVNFKLPAKCQFSVLYIPQYMHF